MPIWKEALFAADLLLLHSSPVYYGLGIPRGDGSGVVLVPGFLGTDAYLSQLHSWLGRIGYRPYFSRIGWNAECPNLLIRQRLNESIDKALLETGAKIHLIGHSLGGIIGRAVADQRPNDIASVITLASPPVAGIQTSSITCGPGPSNSFSRSVRCWRGPRAATSRVPVGL